MKAKASDYYKWPKESSIVSGNCGIYPTFSKIGNIVVTNKKVIVKSDNDVRIIYLKDITYISLASEHNYIGIYVRASQSQDLDIYFHKNSEWSNWADKVFEAINDAVSDLK